MTDDVDDANGVMGRRAAMVTVVAAVVVVVSFLPSCHLRIHPWGKPAYPSVGIVPRRFPPGSARVPFRLQPCGHNPPYPLFFLLTLLGIGLMKGTPGIVFLVSCEAVLRLVIGILNAHSSCIPSPILDAMSVEVVGVHNVHGATHGVTTTKVGEGGRRGRRSGSPGVRQRRQAPGLTLHGVAGGHPNVVKVAVASLMM